MKPWRGFVWTVGVPLLAMAMLLRADSPATQPATSQPATSESAAEKSVRAAVDALLKGSTPPAQPILVVVRPSKGTAAERFAVRDLLRDAAIDQLRQRGLKAEASDELASAMIQADIEGPATNDQIAKLHLSFPVASVLTLAIDRQEDRRTVQLVLAASKARPAQQQAHYAEDDLPPPPDSLLGFGERNLCRAAIRWMLASCAADITAAAKTSGITRLAVTVTPDSGADAFPELEKEIAMQMPKVMSDLYFESFAGTSPATAPADMGFLNIKQAQRGGQRLLSLVLVRTHQTLWSGTARLDNWDLADIPNVPAMDRKIVRFAEVNQGKPVANGECWSLAALALNDAGARFPEGTVFGRELKRGETVWPGDVIQFKNAYFETPEGETMKLGTPDHTAIVREVLSDTACELWEQNPDPVHVGQIDFKYLKSGTFVIYRPLAKR